jgi:DtxR family Mn-dependent transcriptional regulator
VTAGSRVDFVYADPAMATSTVEDYLKRIYIEERTHPGALVPTGRIASAMSVAPGTVTAMMKTLTESGLIQYEPYAGVRLTGAGRKLATHVLRRHRLVELFLVEVMSMDWSDVHAEAEVLEHAVSERLIERIDEMLGRPSVDPHGDPIPTAAGRVVEPEHASLLDCPREVALRVTRVTDQRPEFLRLLERHGLMPDRIAIVESRDELTETLRVRPRDGEPLQLGFQAAGRVLVEPA